MNEGEILMRAICEARCFRAEVFKDPCIDPETRRNAPCRATCNQLALSWRGDAAERVSAALRKAAEK